MPCRNEELVIEGLVDVPARARLPARAARADRHRRRLRRRDGRDPRRARARASRGCVACTARPDRRRRQVGRAQRRARDRARRGHRRVRRRPQVPVRRDQAARSALRRPACRRGAGPLHRPQQRGVEPREDDRDRLLLRLPRQRVRTAVAVQPAGVRRCELRGPRRRRCARSAGWNEDSVTEDTDLTLRLVLSGQRVRYDVTAIDTEEGVPDIRAGSGVSATAGHAGTKKRGSTTAAAVWRVADARRSPRRSRRRCSCSCTTCRCCAASACC